MKVSLTVCLTIVLLTAIGAYTYTQKQALQQKNIQFNEQLQQTRQLDDYNQAQINNRAKVNNCITTAEDDFQKGMCTISTK